MKNVSMRWLSISLFLYKGNWHTLIGNAIKPFIIQLYGDKIEHNFKLAFNHERGDNIRFSLQVASNQKLDIAIMADEYFKSFFHCNQFSTAISDECKINLFMPFNNNTVAYGLYDIVTESGSEYTSALETALSQAIVEAFSGEEIDDEMTLTFALYVLFDCFKIITGKLFTVKRWCRYYQNTLVKLKSTELSLQYIEANYHQIEVAANAIYLDIFEGLDSNDLSWIAKWDVAVGKVWREAQHAEDGEVFLAQINNIISKQLNLGIGAQLLLNTILIKTVTNTAKSMPKSIRKFKT